jgi:hypothetical protein
MTADKAAWVSKGECPTQTVALPLIGGDIDAHGCKRSAGLVWDAELQQCVRPWISSAITLEVASHRQACTGVMTMQCMMVREHLPGQSLPKWEPFFGSIAGFTFVPGQRYKLRVRKDKQDNPPADAPVTTYTLLKVLP